MVIRINWYTKFQPINFQTEEIMITTTIRTFSANCFEGAYGFVDQPGIRDMILKYFEKTTTIISAIWRKFKFLIKQLKFGNDNGKLIHKIGTITKGLLKQIS